MGKNRGASRSNVFNYLLGILAVAIVYGLANFGLLPVEFEEGNGSNNTYEVIKGYEIPEYTGEEIVIINDNEPYFTQEDMKMETFESFSDLDSLGRVGKADAMLHKDMMPKDKRGDIGNVTPTGWEQLTYINGNGKTAYLYNRSHLIGHQFTGQNDNELNLMTGTRKFNHPNMTTFEDEVASYLKDTGNKVRYRVTPAFKDGELLARGVFMEAKSVEDDDVEFNVFIHNVEEGFKINYQTGKAETSRYSVE